MRTGGALALQERLPTISVVVPCRDNSRSLEGLLRSVIPQMSRGDEVILVDDQSTPPERVRLATIARTTGVGLVHLPHPSTVLERSGRRSRARNAATAASSGDVVLYLDGDMILAPDYLSEIRLIHATDQLAMVRGERISLSPREQARGIEHCLTLARDSHFQRGERPVSYSVGWLPPIVGAAGLLGETERPFTRRAFGMLTLGLALPTIGLSHSSPWSRFYSSRWDYCASNNLSLRRRHVVTIGGWDERFLGWGEEDIDFGYRLYMIGLRPVLPIGTRARAFHLDHPVDVEANRRSLLRNARLLLSKFPELRGARWPAYRAWGVAPETLA